MSFSLNMKISTKMSPILYEDHTVMLPSSCVFVVVVGLIDSVLSESKDSQLVSQAVRCVSAWLQLGIPIIECDNLISRLVQTVTTSHSNTQ